MIREVSQSTCNAICRRCKTLQCHHECCSVVPKSNHRVKYLFAIVLLMSLMSMIAINMQTSFSPFLTREHGVYSPVLPSFSSIQKSSCFIFIVGALSNPSQSNFTHDLNVIQPCVEYLAVAVASKLGSALSKHPMCITIMRLVVPLLYTPAGRKYACFVLRTIVKRIALLSSIVSANYPYGLIAVPSADFGAWMPFQNCQNSESCIHDLLFVYLPLELVEMCTQRLSNQPGVIVNASAAVNALAQLRKADIADSVWNLYESFCLASLLLPSDSFLLDSGFDSALQRAADTSENTRRFWRTFRFFLPIRPL